MAKEIHNTVRILNFRKLDYFMKRYNNLIYRGSGYDFKTGEKYVIVEYNDEFKIALEDWNSKVSQDEYMEYEKLREY